MSDLTSILRTEHKDDGSVEYTGWLPALIAIAILFVGAAMCLTAIILSVRLVVWALVASA